VSQRNISNLPPPPKAYRPDKETRREDGQIKFEKPGACQCEDTARAKALRRTANRHPNVVDMDCARKLADQLERSGETGENPESVASSLYMREQRRRIIGALWQLVEE